MLCGRRVTPDYFFPHGMAHLRAVEVSLDAMLALISLIASERGIDDLQGAHHTTIFNEAVEQIFGFRPGTPEALQFWKEHGETP
jgi:hypothetical protein